ncbi:DUF4435 domain-containing protein [Myxococcota bacterium]|nr:DUF4435 domain-containing protein [Myxococcota bacterium]
MTAAEALGAKRESPILAKNKLSNAAKPTVTLLVEAGSDQRFWRMFVRAKVEHMGQGGREAAIKLLDEARTHEDAWFVAALDADLDRVEGRLAQRDDVAWTDAHDLETTLLTTPALGKLAARELGPERLADLERSWGAPLLQRLFACARPMARLRWLKQRRLDALDGLKFKKSERGGELRHFDRWEQLSGGALKPPEPGACVEAVIQFSGGAADTLRREGAGIVNELAALPEADDAQLCNGHDLMALLTLLLRGKLKDSSGDAVAQLSALLAVACERADLEQTSMFAALRVWQAAHPKFALI